MGNCFAPGQTNQTNRTGTNRLNTIEEKVITSKVVIVGAPDAGKTTLITSVGGEGTSPFEDKPVMWRTKVKTTEIHLGIFDTMGIEVYKTITSTFYEHARAVIILFDICDKASYDEVKTWFMEIDRYAKHAHVILVGNKIDLDGKRVIENSIASEFAQEKNVQYFETSAKTGQNVQEIFQSLAKLILEEEQR